MTIRIVQPGEGVLWNLGSQITCKVPSDSTQDEYTVLEVLLETGQGSPLHVHHRESETLYVAQGECIVGNGEKTYAMPTGSVIVFEVDTPHFFRNAGPSKAKLIITAIPGGLDRYFEEINSALQAGNTNNIENINRKYEIEFMRVQ